MTDSKKLDIILSGLGKLDSLESDMQGMKKDMQDMKSDMQSMKKDMQDMKSDIQNLKSDVQNLKSEMRDVKKDVNSLRNQTMKSIAELKAMDKLILDEVERVHHILDKHKADKTMHLA